MFWLLLGPVSLLLTLLAAAGSGSIIAPLCLLFTLPMLWFWRGKAVLPALCIMLSLVFLLAKNLESEFAIAIALGAVFSLLNFSREQVQWFLSEKKVNADDFKESLIFRLQEKIDSLKKINNALDGSNYFLKYQQLREQFQQKSELLDATRKELFHAHEEATRLQRLLEEKEEKLLDEICNALANQKDDEDEKLLREEICELRRLVASLMVPRG